MKAMEDKAKAINAKAKAQTRKDIREPKAFSKEDLIDGLKKGQSDYSGSTWQRIFGIHEGRTIKLIGGESKKSQKMLEEPFEIETDLSDIKLEKLAGKLKEETGICDMYIELKKEKQKRERSELDEITMTPLSNHHNHIDNNHKDHVDKAIQQDRP